MTERAAGRGGGQPSPGRTSSAATSASEYSNSDRGASTVDEHLQQPRSDDLSSRAVNRVIPPARALFPSINAGAGTAELSVFLAKDARGQGIVTRTVEAMIDWAFGVRGLRRLEWRCAPGNEPSRAIPRRLGFTHEGTLREVFRVGANFHDLEVWSLLRDEWRA